MRVFHASGGMRHLKVLDMCENNLHGYTVVELARVLKSNGQLRAIELGRCLLDHHDCYAVLTIMQSNQLLEELSLRGNRIGRRGIQILQLGIHTSQLWQLDLGYTMSADGGKPDSIFQSNLLSSQEMQTVELMGNILTTEDAACALRATESAEPLSWLNLCQNSTGNDVVHVLTGVLRRRSERALLERQQKPNHVDN